MTLSPKNGGGGGSKKLKIAAFFLLFPNQRMCACALQSLPDDLLRAVVCVVPSDSLLCMALACKRVCLLCDERRRREGGRWRTSVASTSVRRLEWAVDNGAVPRPMWYFAAAACDDGDVFRYMWWRYPFRLDIPTKAAIVLVAVQRGSLSVVKAVYDALVVPSEVERLEAVYALELHPVHAAAIAGNVATLDFLWSSRHADTLTFGGLNSLHCAASRGHISVARWLLDKGMRVDVCASNGLRPIHFAAMGGHLACVRFLNERGAPVTARCSGCLQRTVAHYAVLGRHISVLKWLCARRGAQVVMGEVDSSGCHLAHTAALHGSVRVLQWLHAHGASLTSRDSFGSQPIHYAARRGQLAVVAWLHTMGVSLRASSERGVEVVHYAASSGHVPTVRWLLEQGVSATTVDGNGHCARWHALQHSMHDTHALLVAAADGEPVHAT